MQGQERTSNPTVQNGRKLETLDAKTDCLKVPTLKPDTLSDKEKKSHFLTRRSTTKTLVQLLFTDPKK
jgi:hypothetical protein